MKDSSRRLAVVVAALALIAVGRAWSQAPATPAVRGTPGGGEASSQPAAAHREVATLAGGCFWGMEEILRQIPGVTSTRVGYTGGTTSNPTYPEVHAGDSGHAEAVEVVFDPTKISYAEILGYFFRMHDPTTRNRQGNDVGTSARRTARRSSITRTRSGRRRKK